MGGGRSISLEPKCSNVVSGVDGIISIYGLQNKRVVNIVTLDLFLPWLWRVELDSSQTAMSITSFFGFWPKF